MTTRLAKWSCTFYGWQFVRHGYWEVYCPPRISVCHLVGQWHRLRGCREGIYTVHSNLESAGSQPLSTQSHKGEIQSTKCDTSWWLVGAPGKVLRACILIDTRIPQTNARTTRNNIVLSLDAQTLTPTNSDSDTLEAITPIHFLFEQSSATYPTLSFEKEIHHRKRFLRVQAYAKAVWWQWLGEYAPSLNKRAKWHSSAEQELKTGDLVHQTPKILSFSRHKKTQLRKRRYNPIHRTKNFEYWH